jgi:hypothetical protein
MRLFMVSIVFVLVSLSSGCETIKPYEKEYLLNPLMDDGSVADLKSNMRSSSSSRHEKLAGNSSGSSSTSCPTCGG